MNASLDFEGANQEYVFQVRATDSRAGSTNPHVMVTIRVIDLDEKPEIAPFPEDPQTLIEHAGGNAIETWRDCGLGHASCELPYH